METITKETLDKKAVLERERNFITSIIDRCYKYLDEQNGNLRIEKLALKVKGYAIQEYIKTLEEEEEVIEKLIKEI